MVLYNPENVTRLLERDKIGESKVRLLKQCFERLSDLHGTEILNFMLLVHEIMTRFLNLENTNEMLNCLTSYAFIQELFALLRK